MGSHIEDHLAEQITLDDLAKLVRMSPWHFCRVFKRSFGVPPHRYQIDRRIERAKVLLTRPDLLVTDVALEVGYQETSSFTTAFRNLTGLPPSVYRRTFGAAA